MKVSDSPDPTHDSGRIVPVPAVIKDRLLPWAEPLCKMYDFGYILLQELITPSFNIYRTVFNFQQRVKLYCCWDHNLVTLQYTREGAMVYWPNQQTKLLLETTQYFLLYLAAGTNACQVLPGISEWLYIETGPSCLGELLLAHASMHKMLLNLCNTGNTSGVLFPARMNGKVKSIIHEIYNCNKTGPSLMLEMKSQVYRLLSAYDEDITWKHYLENIRLSKTAKTVMAIKQYIIGYPHIHECSLKKLSIQFSISTAALKVNFKKQCDIPISDFVRQQCFLKAHELLQSHIGSVRDIALQLGYSDVSNFSRAFRSYMGCAPHEMQQYSQKNIVD